MKYDSNNIFKIAVKILTENNMSNQKERVFAEGFMFKRKDTAPKFVIGSQSIKVDEAIAFLQLHQKNGWVNIDIKQSKGDSSKYYCELDQFVPKPRSEESVQSSSSESDVLF